MISSSSYEAIENILCIEFSTLNSTDRLGIHYFHPFFFEGVFLIRPLVYELIYIFFLSKNISSDNKVLIIIRSPNRNLS